MAVPRGRRFAIYRTPTSASDTEWHVEHRVPVAPWAQHLRPAFDALREDRSRTLGRDELIELCPNLQPDVIDRLFAAVHSSDEERVSFDKVCAFVLLANHGAPEEKIESIFTLCDADADNEVLAHELAAAIKLMFYARTGDPDVASVKAALFMEELLAAGGGGSSSSTGPPSGDAPVGAASSTGADATSEAEPHVGTTTASPHTRPMASSNATPDSAGGGESEVSNACGGEGPVRDKEESADGDGPSSGLRTSLEDSAEVLAVDTTVPIDQVDPAQVCLSRWQYLSWVHGGGDLVQELGQQFAEGLPPSSFAPPEPHSGSCEAWLLPAKVQFEKIRVENPVVELDGDEMPRIMWQMIKERLIFPFLDMDIDYYDLSITYRDETEDQVTRDAAKAIKRHNVGIKCAAITPDNARMLEFGLQDMWQSPSLTLRSVLQGNIFRAPIMLSGIPRPIPGWDRPIVVGRHLCGDQYEASQAHVEGTGAVKLALELEDGPYSELDVHAFTSPGGVVLGMYNTKESVESYARCCFEYALAHGLPVYFSTKNNILKEYDGMFQEVFSAVYHAHYKKVFEEKGLWYQHRLVDDVAAKAIRSHGGFVWACKNYDGDIMSDWVAQGFGGDHLMVSTLICPDGRTMLTESAHGTVTRHYRAHQRGENTSTNPLASIFAWTRGLAHRARLDNNIRLAEFCAALEEACVTCVSRGQISLDLALLVHGEQVTPDHWLRTEDLFNAFASELRLALQRPRIQRSVAQQRHADH